MDGVAMDDVEDRLALSGLPAYPPLALQVALHRSAQRWRIHASHGPAGLCGFASQVAEASKRLRPASIAVELPADLSTPMRTAARILSPVLSELGHPRFLAIPDLRALQRLTTQQQRQHMAGQLAACQLDKLHELRLFGWVEGMDLMMALHLASEGVAVHCIDLPVADQDSNQGPGSGSSGVMTRVQEAAEAAAAAEGEAFPSRPAAATPAMALQAGWAATAWERIVGGVNRGLVSAEEFAVMSRFHAAVSHSSALMRPAALARQQQQQQQQAAHNAAANLGSSSSSSSWGEQGLHREREWHMAQQVMRLPRPVLVVVGAAHVPGLLQALHRLAGLVR
ncbi:hypothetical protein QJQ45_020498 [Haematococcus lacustris]|nr:hypothetical protein QJQ45_020498 [Haematococcus lacustris]